MKPIINTITQDWIDKNNPCPEALDWYKDYLDKEPIMILKRLIKAEKYDWANWFIVRVMEYRDYVAYGVYAAESVIDIFKKKYPDDKRLRKAIEATKRCIENPSEENKEAAGEAAWAAARAAAGAAARAAAGAAAWAAWEAARAAAGAAAGAAWAAAGAAARAAAGAAMQLKILNYGMELIGG